MKNIDKYNNIFKKVFSVEEGQLNEEFSILNVEKWDSVAHMELITQIEDTFGIMLETDDIIGLSSYTNGLELLGKYDITFQEEI